MQKTYPNLIILRNIINYFISFCYFLVFFPGDVFFLIPLNLLVFNMLTADSLS